MTLKRSLQSMAGITALLWSNLAFAQQYHSNDITPPLTTAGKLTGASQGRQVGGGINGHAYMMTGNALSAADLHPTGWYSSMALASDDIEQCGYGASPIGGFHAIRWTGTATGYTDLQPSGYNFSYCVAVDNGKQAGFAENQVYFLTTSHAMLWSGTNIPVDLHPASIYPYSRAMSLKGGEQVGYVSSVAYPYGDYFGYHATSHAYRWTGASAGAQDLHPAAFDASEALATNGVQQGGWGYTVLGASHLHALLWSGDAQTVVDLHPAAYTDSRITAMNATQQVGDAWVGGPGLPGSVRHALLWSGTPESVVDLNQFLPTGYTNAVATGIDANGNAVGYATNNVGNYGLSMPPDAIAVVFAPGQPPPSSLTSITLNPSAVTPGGVAQGTVTLSATAPAGGVNISFLSTNVALAATPAALIVPEGSITATFTVPALGAALTVPAAVKIYATDGSVSAATSLSVAPVVNPTGLTANAVEGGFNTYGFITLNIPAQGTGAVVSLTSGNPALVTVPASITVPAGYTSYSFSMSTVPVAATTVVPVTATFNGQTVTAQLSLSSAPVVSVSTIVTPATIGGQSFTGTVSVTNFPRGAAGATITLSSGDASVQVPATVVVPYGAFSVSFTGTTSVVNGLKNVSIKGTYNGTSASGLIALYPIPTVTIISAEYFTDTQLFKVQANTTFANSVLTYGTSPSSPPVGTMQIELGVWKGSTLMATAPTQATVWNSNGGFATGPVVIRTPAGTGGGGGGGGTGSTFKLTIVTTGKGSVATNPAGTTFNPGTAVTLTATPAAGQPWVGWSGACTGTSKTCTVTMNSNLSVNAFFK